MDAPCTCTDIAQVNVALARLDERQKAAMVALELATAELARRLDDLNHAHAQARSDAAAFVGRDKFESEADRLREKVDEARKLADERIGRLEAWQATMQGRMWVAGAVVLVLAGTIAAVARLL